MENRDIAEALAEQVKEAVSTGQGLRIEGGGSKAFLGRSASEHTLKVGLHRGIVHYEPVELMLTARAGTPLREIEATLAAHDQMLAFEPPHFGEEATLGGTIATNLSGPRRPFAGAARDFVLGVRMVNGRGEILRFGGEVMKNVAGYDVSRLMTGSHGTLGVILDVSLKVLPRPPADLTLCQELDPEQAIRQTNLWAGQSLPLSAVAYDGARVYLRLSGAEEALSAAEKRIGGERLDRADDFWKRLREHQTPFFRHPGRLWRMSVASTAAPINLPGYWLIDWAGSQRWYKGEAPAAEVRQAAIKSGGHATAWAGSEQNTPQYQPLPSALQTLHRRIKAAFDPDGVFNPGHPFYPQA
ncbi:glycolate oxidase subunit GlcE [Acidihalobacter prosperus]